MRFIPVLDVMGGQVVRAIAGKRDEYRPIESRLVDSTDPVRVADALLRVTGSDELYVADLDAILGRPRDHTLAPALLSLGPTVWLDAGFHTDGDSEGLEDQTQLCPVFGSESGATPDVVRRAVDRFGPGRVIVSIDLAPGTAIGSHWLAGLLAPSNWPRFAKWIHEMGVSRAIILDLWRVGTGEGVSTGEAARLMKQSQPGLEVVTGGGVRDWVDVKRLEEVGVDAVLVASAVHNGALTFPRPAC